jgi:hypothetical protein
MRVGSVSDLRRLASLTAQHERSRYNVPENGAARGARRTPTRIAVAPECHAECGELDARGSG